MQGVNGNKMEKACDLVHITLNKNAVVGDVSALAPGGVRIGAPAMTSRGLKEANFEAIADLLHEVGGGKGPPSLHFFPPHGAGPGRAAGQRSSAKHTRPVGVGGALSGIPGEWFSGQAVHVFAARRPDVPFGYERHACLHARLLVDGGIAREMACSSSLLRLAAQAWASCTQVLQLVLDVQSRSGKLYKDWLK